MPPLYPVIFSRNKYYTGHPVVAHTSCLLHFPIGDHRYLLRKKTGGYFGGYRFKHSATINARRKEPAPVSTLKKMVPVTAMPTMPSPRRRASQGLLNMSIALPPPEHIIHQGSIGQPGEVVKVSMMPATIA
jgi:hypothetical protein